MLWRYDSLYHDIPGTTLKLRLILQHRLVNGELFSLPQASQVEGWIRDKVATYKYITLFTMQAYDHFKVTTIVNVHDQPDDAWPTTGKEECTYPTTLTQRKQDNGVQGTDV